MRCVAYRDNDDHLSVCMSALLHMKSLLHTVSVEVVGGVDHGHEASFLRQLEKTVQVASSWLQPNMVVPTGIGPKDAGPQRASKHVPHHSKCLPPVLQNYAWGVPHHSDVASAGIATLHCRRRDCTVPGLPCAPKIHYQVERRRAEVFLLPPLLTAVVHNLIHPETQEKLLLGRCRSNEGRSVRLQHLHQVCPNSASATQDQDAVPLPDAVFAQKHSRECT
mmetsp:Transcript_4227/g.8145  ORF Transcript_4227/g.8145 Transcript_4227/m.8145 type:complete len:221 (-) Transcript_4227:139-801(-)